MVMIGGSVATRPEVPATAPGRLVHLPGLDGVRGLAVAAVVLYHLGYGWAGGGFLGVSLFFTLSGYLVVSLILAEHDRRGRVSLGSFWARRARRIVPASLLALTGVAVASHWLPTHAGLPGDVRAALAQVANWRFVFTHRSYADRFAAPSPLKHLWSLAIEEQLYLVLPLVCVVALRFGRRWLGWALGLLAAGSVAMSLLLSNASLDRVYQGTDTRAVEVLAGGLLACIARPSVLAAVRRRWWSHLATMAPLAGLCAVWWFTRLTQPWLRTGGFGLVAVANVAVVTVAAGPVGARLLGWRPLASLGRISYGLYLFHWPLIVWLTPERTGWSPRLVDAVRVGGALAVSVLSYRFFEQPIRRGRVAGHRIAPVGASAAFALFSLTMQLGVAPLTGAAGVLAGYDPSSLARLTEVVPTTVPVPAAAIDGAVAPAPPTTAPPPPPPPELWLAGDSVPYSLGPALTTLGTTRRFDLVNLAVPGCDGARGNPTERIGLGLEHTDERAECADWTTSWPAVARARPPTVVLFVLGGNVTLDRKVNGEWRSPCDAEFRSWYEPEVLARIDWVVANTGAVPVLTVSPYAEDKAVGVLQRDHRDRTDCLNEIYRSVAAQRPALAMLDLQSFVCPAGKAEPCRPWRTDGLHFDGDGAVAVAAWLVDHLAPLAASSA